MRGHAGKHQIDQSHVEFLIAARAGDHFRHPAEHVDVRLGVTKLNLLQILRSERLLLHRLRRVDRDVHPLIGQREGSAADDEVLAGRNLKLSERPTFVEDGIPRLGKLLNVQSLTIPNDLCVLPRDSIIPRRGPTLARTTKNGRATARKRSSPAPLWVASLCN